VDFVKGGIAPNRAGRVSPLAAKLTTSGEIKSHQEITDAVHENNVCDTIKHVYFC